MNKPIRSETQVRVVLTSTSDAITGFSGFDTDMSNDSFADRSYVASFALNGCKVGDSACTLKSRNSDMTLMYQTSMTEGRILFARIINLDIPKIHIEFVDVRPDKIVFVSGDDEKVFTEGNDFDISDLATTEVEIYFEDIPSGSRVKVNAFSVGLYYEFTNNELKAVDHLVSTDLISATMPINKFVFTILDYEGRFDPANPNGEYQYLERGDNVTISYGYGNDLLLHSINYLNDIPVFDNGVLTLTAVSDLELRSETYVRIPVEFRSVGHIVGGLIMGNLPVNLDDFDSSYDNNSNSIITDMEENQLIQISANATASYLTVFDKDVFVHSIVPNLDKAPVNYHLTSDDMRDKYPKVSLNNKVKNVKISCDVWKTNEVYEDYTIEHPMWVRQGSQYYGYATLPDKYSKVGYVGVVSGAPSGTYVEPMPVNGNRGVGIALVSDSQPSDSAVVVRLHMPITEAITVEKDIAGVVKGDVLPINNPVISGDSFMVDWEGNDSMTKIAEAIARVYNNRQVYEVTFSQDFRLEVGDVILVDTKYENNVKMIITELHYTLPGRWGVLKGRRIG